MVQEELVVFEVAMVDGRGVFAAASVNNMVLHDAGANNGGWRPMMSA